MKKRVIYLFNRGILGWQSIFGDWGNWPNQSVSWIHNQTEAKAQTLTYFTGPILAGLTRPHRAHNQADMMKQYPDWDINVVAHSEGTATDCLALQYARWPKIKTLHLVCGACDSDYQRLGLNAALALGRIQRVFVYIGGRDKAMKLEDTWVGSLCFGLQTAHTPMGLNGPVNQTPTAKERTTIIKWDDYGHSTCWDGNHFERTMKQIYDVSQ